MNWREVNFDGLIGPTHNYAGLSPGNRASLRNRAAVSNPRSAALQGLQKMHFLARLGCPQAVVPPLCRPAFSFLRSAGFTGPELRLVECAYREAPDFLAACYSASSMWVANAVTTTPGLDSRDGRVHVTPANLLANTHRTLEAAETSALWQRLLPDPDLFTHHPPLPANLMLTDEGAANHTRFAARQTQPGTHFFVHGRTGREPLAQGPYPRRQTLEASQAVVRTHRLPPGRVVHAQQHPDAIAAGAFHNDVIATGHEHVLLHHPLAFSKSTEVVDALQRAFAEVSETPLYVRPLLGFSLEEAIESYVFNSQVLTREDGSMLLLAPEESRSVPAVAAAVAALVADPLCPIRQVHHLDLRQSMRNGGGPACLRNRLVLSDAELAAIPRGIRYDEALHERLTAWVTRHYRSELRADDFRDPQFPTEIRTALDELSTLLELGSIYPFQEDGMPRIKESRSATN
ncbi:MAG TPA: N-succinylarginine dihydrolase [Chthoniobacterales bacterium]